MSLGEQSSLIVKNRFSIYSGTCVYVRNHAALTLGSGYMNNDCRIICTKSITIGENAAIAGGVVIRDSDDHSIVSHPYQMTKPVVIGNHVWIGENAMILKGVHIGDGSIVGAGSVVTKDVPPNSLVAGVPARVIRTGVAWE